MQMAQFQEDVYHYWQTKCPAEPDQLPSRNALKIKDLGHIMSHVIVADILNNPRDMQYRLIGTYVRDFLHDDYTGKRFSELDGKGPGSKIWQLHEHILDIRRPVFCNLPYVGPKTDYMQMATLFLPLASDNITIDKIMGVLNFEPRVDPISKILKENVFEIIEL